MTSNYYLSNNISFEISAENKKIIDTNLNLRHQEINQGQISKIPNNNVFSFRIESKNQSKRQYFQKENNVNQQNLLNQNQCNIYDQPFINQTCSYINQTNSRICKYDDSVLSDILGEINDISNISINNNKFNPIQNLNYRKTPLDILSLVNSNLDELSFDLNQTFIDLNITINNKPRTSLFNNEGKIKNINKSNMNIDFNKEKNDCVDSIHWVSKDNKLNVEERKERSKSKTKKEKKHKKNKEKIKSKTNKDLIDYKEMLNKSNTRQLPSINILHNQINDNEEKKKGLTTKEIININNYFYNEKHTYTTNYKEENTKKENEKDDSVSYSDQMSKYKEFLMKNKKTL